MDKKKLLIVFLLSLGLLIPCTSQVFGFGVFKEGVVTKKVWGEEPFKIRISKIKYKIMPDARVTRTVKNIEDDNFTVKEAGLQELKKGTPVYFKVLGHNIYEIQIKP